jgi:hypothetical protein
VRIGDFPSGKTAFMSLTGFKNARLLMKESSCAISRDCRSQIQVIISTNLSY